MGGVLVFIGMAIIWGLVMAVCWPLGLAGTLIIIGMMLNGD